MSDNSPQFDTAYKWLQDNIDTRMWDMNSALSLANLLRAEHAPASQSAQGAPEPPRWIPPKAEQLIRRLHEIAATSDEETGAALSETADMLAACFDEKIKVCPICGNEEVHPGTGMLTCECPALKRFSDETQRMAAPQPDSGETQQLEKEIRELQKALNLVISAAIGWNREHNMYRNAWLREMGGEIRRKTHEIDGFVLRTREIYEGYKQVPELKQRIAELEQLLAAPQPVAEREGGKI